jgi:hypothetical protein
MLSKNLIVVLPILLPFVFTTWIKAQTTNSSYADSTCSDYKNKYALQFYLVNGLSIAGKKQFSDNSALKLQLDFSADLTSSDSDQKRIFNGTEIIRELKNEENSQSINTSFQYLYYPYVSKNVDLIVGIGPHLGFYRGFYNEDYNYSSYEYTLYEYQLGFLLTSGCETHISENLSIFAEYKISFSHSWYDFESESQSFDQSGILQDTTDYKNDKTSWDIYLSKVRLGFTLNL